MITVSEIGTPLAYQNLAKVVKAAMQHDMQYYDPQPKKSPTPTLDNKGGNKKPVAKTDSKVVKPLAKQTIKKPEAKKDSKPIVGKESKKPEPVKGKDSKKSPSTPDIKGGDKKQVPSVKAKPSDKKPEVKKKPEPTKGKAPASTPSPKSANGERAKESSKVQKDKKDDQPRFIAENQFQYEVAIVSWLALLQDNNPDVAWAVRDMIQNSGLRLVIASASQAADDLVRHQPLARPWYGLQGGLKEKLQSLRYLKRFTPCCTPVLQSKAIESYIQTQNRLAKMWGTPGLEEAYIGSSLHSDLKVAFERLVTPFWVEDVPDFVKFTPGSHVGVGRLLADKVGQLTQCDPEAFVRGRLPVDAQSLSLLSWDGTLEYRSLPAKLAASDKCPKTWAQFACEIANADRAGNRIKVEHLTTVNGYTPIQWRAMTRHTELGYDRNGNSRAIDINSYTGTAITAKTKPWMTRSVNAVLGVPKSYKAWRLIAPETTYRQFCATRLAEATEHNFTYLARNVIPLHDQSRNCRMAAIGSVDGSLATIDQSSASDSISETLFRSIVPQWYSDLCDVYDIRSRLAMVPGAYAKKRIRNPHTGLLAYTQIEPVNNSGVEVSFIPLQTHLSMGNGCTFLHESMVFAAIAIVAIERYYGRGFSDKELCDILSVYGDDVILPSDAAPLFMDILQYLGCLPNLDKSFWKGFATPDGSEHYFRESCGEEYYDGLRVDSIYWPRREIGGKPADIASLIALQHRFASHRVLGRYFARVCRAIEPKLTSHRVGTECGDLWEELPKTSYVSAPMDMSRFSPAFAKRLREVVKQCNLLCDPEACGYVDVPLYPGCDTVPVDPKDPNKGLIPWSVYLREVHYTSEPVYPKALPSWYEGDTGKYCIREFLESGPYYPDPLLELLGCSVARRDARTLFKYTDHYELQYKLVVSKE